MVKTPLTDTIDPVDPFIAGLYRSGVSVSAEQFRPWALQQLAKVVPCDGALWGSGTSTQWKFHTVTVMGLPPEFPRVLEQTTRINPIIPRILQNLDTPVDMASVISDDEFFSSEIYRRAFAPFGISRILSTAHLDRRSGLYSLVTLYRKAREALYSDADKARQKRATYHLFNAASHAFFLHVMRTLQGRPTGSVSAVCDREGTFHEAQPGFLDLIEERFPSRKVSEGLPFAVPPPGAPTAVQDLMVESRPLADLFLVTAWRAGPLDRLTLREREIVTCVAQGLSFKQAAKKVGVAPSTVANHLYRVYRKLGVYSRTELAALVYPASS
jgi:DNA-binding CsgD family transcriptional regulator